MKAVQPVIASNAIPWLQITSVGIQWISGRDKEGREGDNFKKDVFRINLPLFSTVVRWKDGGK